LVIGCWLLVVGYWLLVIEKQQTTNNKKQIDYWLLVIGC
jgi:hypothetical protein